jgi:ATP phosphoribosyltransferase regulatory subunit
MQQKDSWLLPEGIEEILPEEATRLEYTRRKILDMFACWGYELVIPPFVDYLDSLLTGSGHDLDLQTFKLTDQVSGETLGIRADMTPQVARIDAHNLKRECPTRLCYAGTILHTNCDSLQKSRSPMQIGAELYGHSGTESDIEVIQLMLEMLAMTGLENVHLDLGHVGIYRSLSEQAGLTELQETELFDILQRKARPELQDLMADFEIDQSLKNMFLQLPQLNGGIEVIEKARLILASANQELKTALDQLDNVARKLAINFPGLPISFDLSELRGYHYHTGMVFSAFVPEVGREIARGGRYDNIGAVFGRQRAATGFSADLKLLSTLGKNSNGLCHDALIFAPSQDEPELHEKIRELRAEGKKVIQQLPGQSGGAEQMGCTQLLEKHNQTWVVKTSQ